jgi:hypothetical protein
VWNGLAEPGDALTGSCVPGAYNGRTTPNIGAACRSSDECDSPFGYGECLFANLPEVGSGMCTVQSCATFLGDGDEVVQGLLPGVATASPICDPARGEMCVSLRAATDPPLTYCLRRCETAAECAPGYGCVELVTAGTRFCWPTCFEAADCRAGATCEASSGLPCTAADDACYCSDRTTR